MDAAVVVGVGNIYANEALFAAAIHPKRAAGRVGAEAWCRLTEAIKSVLLKAIEAGGTTLNDFQDSDGSEGYFQQHLCVYNRTGEPCLKCKKQVRKVVLGGRSTFYCPGCQRW